MTPTSSFRKEATEGDVWGCPWGRLHSGATVVRMGWGERLGPQEESWLPTAERPLLRWLLGIYATLS